VLEMIRRNIVGVANIAGIVALVGLVGGLLLVGGDEPRRAKAQNYPTNNPVYIPNAILAVQTLAAPGVVNFQNNGVGTLVMRLAGTNTGVAGTLQCTESRAASPTYTNVGVQTVVVGGARGVNITGNGLYKANVAGFAQCQFNLTAISTGSVTVAMSGGPNDDFVSSLPAVRPTYSGAALIATGATTHFLSLAGSATTTVRVTRVSCSGYATSAITVDITAEIDSTADTVDAGTTITMVPHDSTSPAATAVLKSHTTSPTRGTLVGNVRAGELTLGLPAATTPPTKLEWTFGPRFGAQEIVLRGVAQSFSLNTSAAFGTGASVGCDLEATEE
jgi:hypothetical protein